MSNRHYPVKETDIRKLNSKLLSISYAKDEGDWTNILHTHHFTELLLVVDGKGSFLFGTENHPIKPGDLVIIPPYTEHTEQSSKDTPLEYYVLGIDGISFMDSANPTGQILCNFKNDPSILELFRQMLFEIRTLQYGSEAICQHLLEILILKIIRTWKLVPVPISSIKMTKECMQIKEYLDTNYAQHITLDTLTALTHMNKYYMVHSFTKYTGLSPIQYLNQQRLKTACRLLESFNYSIAQISSLTGFSSQSYFTQTFRKAYGMTPIKYRQTRSLPKKEKD
ncbi:AraC family transcriptional regulator [Sellimonas caecigallum]|uniref:AraC family transcriptional regulator n=1 Tax=Sellimonas caecigallum TaxID=2592333 RepID=A0ABS7L599_9FIRM|nr:AraC family transcriptional regulator [Sellimonas caecigallum]MBY0758092.1 AraC family transcriptional regulator [Sellimonas caecigallum]